MGLSQGLRNRVFGRGNPRGRRPAALLHLESTAKGLLMPRVTNTQMLAVSSPATSDLVWNNTYTNFYYYTGSFWTPLSGSGWALTSVEPDVRTGWLTPRNRRLPRRCSSMPSRWAVRVSTASRV